MTEYKIFGNELSLFSRKLEAAFIFYDVPFEFLPQDPAMNQRAGTHQIPVLQTPEDWVIADTTPIMQMMDCRIKDRALFPGGLHGLLVRILEEYLDEWIARVMVHYRWHYKECAEFAAMKIANGNELIAKGIAEWGPRACRATGTESETQQQAAEEEYERLLVAANSQLANTAYLLGNRPTAVDAIFLGGLRGHTNVDPVPKALVQKFPNIVSWLEKGAMHWNGQGGLLSIEQPGEFAQMILDEMAETYKPFVMANKLALEAGEKFFVCNVFNEDVSILTRPYPEKSRQMVLDYFVSELDAEEKQQAESFLEKYSLKEVFAA